MSPAPLTVVETERVQGPFTPSKASTAYVYVVPGVTFSSTKVVVSGRVVPMDEPSRYTVWPATLPVDCDHERATRVEATLGASRPVGVEGGSGGVAGRG